MKKLTLHNGDKISALGLGTWKADESTYPAVCEALKIGYRHIDCALRYENEREVGRAVKDTIASGELSRQDIWLTSKLWNNAHQHEQVRAGLVESLTSLGVDYLDLYLIHWPVALKPHVIFPDKGDDFLSLDQVPLLETWQAMEACVEEGLCRNIGVSNFSMKKIRELQAKAKIQPSVNQIEGHPLLQQKKLLQFCKDSGIIVTAYSPLGSLDRPARLISANEPTLLGHPVITRIAESQNCTPAQVLIAWALQRGTSVIPKSSNPARLLENFEAEKITLADDQMNEIAAMDKHYRFIHGTFWTIEGSPYSLSDLWDES